MNESVKTQIPPCRCGAPAKHWWSPGWETHQIKCSACDLSTGDIPGAQSALAAWTKTVEAGKGRIMTDQELAEWLHLTPEEAAIVLPKLSAGRRALYDRMKQVEIEATLWVEGLGPKPVGVLIDTERATKRRRAWK